VYLATPGCCLINVLLMEISKVNASTVVPNGDHTDEHDAPFYRHDRPVILCSPIEKWNLANRARG